MGLGLPLALLALLGVGIPLWIHRVRRRTLREVPLPTIALLERALAKKRRALSFRDRPLLYARIALVALFALALARPFLSQVASYATERPIAITIVIDDSMSMQRKAKRGGTLFEAARARADRVVGELAPDSEATIVLAGHEPRVLASRSTDTLSLRALLARLDRTGGRGTDLGPALSLGLRELAGTKLTAREALVLTDCASHANADKLDAPGTHLRVECIEPREGLGNAHVASVALRRSSLGPDAPTSLILDLAAPENMTELDVVVRIDSRRVGETTVTMRDGRGSTEIELPADEVERGHVVEARITTPNGLAEDDVRELPLDRGAELALLLVDGDPAPNQLDDELRFVALALAIDSDGRGAPRVTRVDPDGLPSTDLAKFDVVVLANVRAPTDEQAGRIERFVKRGGGLLIAAGEHVDAFAYRGRFGALLPAVPRSAAPAGSPLGLALERLEPTDLVPQRGEGLETARTFERLLVEPPVAPARTVLAFSDGTPAVIASTYGTGKVAVLTTTLDDDWTDLPLTPGFLPLIHGIVRGLAAVDALPKGPQPAGSVLTARVPLGASSLYVVTPDGRRVDLDTKKPTVRIDDTAVVGVYRAFASLDERGEREVEQLSFNMVADVRESALTLQKPKPEQQKLAQAGAGRPRGIESWFWLLLGLVALAEGALRLGAKKRAEAAAV